MQDSLFDNDQSTPPEPMPQPVAPVEPPQSGSVPVEPVSEPQTQAEHEVQLEAEYEAESAQEQAAPEAEPEVDELDAIEPKTDNKSWTIGDPSLGLNYIQTPLSFIGKMQWFALVGDVIDRAMSGPSAVSVNDLLSSPNNPGATLSMSDLREADTFVRAIGKLLIHAPEFLVESYCIWLSVPKHERELVAEIMQSPAANGGLTDADGMEMIERFIDQNYDELADFFSVQVAGLQKRVAAKQKARSAGKSA